MTPTELPEEVKPSAEALARDQHLAERQRALMADIEKDSGQRVKVITPHSERIQYGANGEIVDHIVNGESKFSREERAVRAAQAKHNAQLGRMKDELDRVVKMRDEINGYDKDGKPRYARNEAERERLTKLARQLEFSMVGQARLSDRAWRKEAAPAIRQAQQDRISAAELAKELQDKGRVQYIPSF